MTASDEARIHRISLRLPDDLHQRAKAASERDHRSLHGELLHLIERGLDAASQGEDHHQGG